MTARSCQLAVQKQTRYTLEILSIVNNLKAEIQVALSVMENIESDDNWSCQIYNLLVALSRTQVLKKCCIY